MFNQFVQKDKCNSEYLHYGRAKKSMKKKVSHNFRRFYFAVGYFLQIVLFTEYMYPVFLLHTKKEEKPNRESNIEVKLPKTDCKWLSVNAQPVLMKVLLYFFSLHYTQNSEDINMSHNLGKFSPRKHLTAILISSAKAFSRFESGRKIHFHVLKKVCSLIICYTHSVMNVLREQTLSY